PLKLRGRTPCAARGSGLWKDDAQIEDWAIRRLVSTSVSPNVLVCHVLQIQVLPQPGAVGAAEQGFQAGAPRSDLDLPAAVVGMAFARHQALFEQARAQATVRVRDVQPAVHTVALQRAADRFLEDFEAVAGHSGGPHARQLAAVEPVRTWLARAI